MGSHTDLTYKYQKNEIFKLQPESNIKRHYYVLTLTVTIKSYLVNNKNHQLYLLKPINKPLLTNSFNLILDTLTFLLTPLLLEVIKHLLLIAQKKSLLFIFNFEKMLKRL